jgi:hypothetical protein
VADPNIHPEIESQKRRTTRIVQAVPLTVSGVDALGRPFQERTSTLIVNCHGCRYQSKHYVLKNMWVTLEVPHNEPGHDPRSVRARVNWIQRPRTVRELFQIGVELEVSGNVWGIAFPPGDWFPFPESASAPRLEISAPSGPPQNAPEAEDWSTAEEMPLMEAPSPRALEPVQDNVRVLPITGSKDASMQGPQQIARLVDEAKQQIQGILRESVNEAVAAETRTLLADLRPQLMEAAKESAAAVVAAQVEEAQRETLRNRQSEREAALSALREEMVRERSRQASEARQYLNAQLAEVERVWQADFNPRIQNQLQATIQKLESMTQALGARENEARITLEQMRISSEQAATNELHLWQEQMDQRSADAQARLAEMDRAAENLKEQVAAAAASGEVAWRGALDAEVESAIERWRQRTDTLIEEASRLAAEKFGENAEATGRQIEKQLQQRISAIDNAQSQVAADAESVVAGMAERFQSTLQATGRKTLEQLVGELHQRLSPQMARVEEAASKLMLGREQAEKSLAEHQERVWQASDRNLKDTVTRGKELLAQIETEFGESAREVIARWMGELEAKATETAQGTFEALFKSADWYEKKAQNQMQTTLQKGVDQATAHLREKAAELSAMFARELDHGSRTYIEHAQRQIQEGAADAAERASQQIAEAGDAAGAQFHQHAGQVGQQQRENLLSESQAIQRQFRTSLEPLGIAAIDEHKKRLDSASNAWLLTTVTKLNHQSERLIADLADATEKRLKAVCSAVISEMSATLRQRVGGLSVPPRAPATPASPSPPPPAVNPLEEKK